MDSLTIAIAYYENPHMLLEQQRVISKAERPFHFHDTTSRFEDLGLLGQMR